jgi:hypothetical protein
MGMHATECEHQSIHIWRHRAWACPGIWKHRAWTCPDICTEIHKLVLLSTRYIFGYQTYSRTPSLHAYSCRFMLTSSFACTKVNICNHMRIPSLLISWPSSFCLRVSVRSLARQMCNRPSLIVYCIVLDCIMSIWVQTIFGEGAIVVVDGQRVVPQRLHDLQFRFKYSRIEPAIANILGQR